MPFVNSFSGTITFVRNSLQYSTVPTCFKIKDALKTFKITGYDRVVFSKIGICVSHFLNYFFQKCRPFRVNENNVGSCFVGRINIIFFLISKPNSQKNLLSAKH